MKVRSSKFESTPAICANICFFYFVSAAVSNGTTIWVDGKEAVVYNVTTDTREITWVYYTLKSRPNTKKKLGINNSRISLNPPANA